MVRGVMVFLRMPVPSASDVPVVSVMISRLGMCTRPLWTRGLRERAVPESMSPEKLTVAWDFSQLHRHRTDVVTERTLSPNGRRHRTDVVTERTSSPNGRRHRTDVV